MNRIISKEKEREDPRRDSSKTSFQLESKSVSSVSTRNPASYNYKFNSAYRINSTTRNSKESTTTRLIPCRHPPATAPVYPSILHGRIKLQASLQHPRLPRNRPGRRRILGGRNSTLHGSQPHALPSSDSPGILQGIHLVSTKFTKGSSITLHCNTTRSVCSNLLLLALRIILQEN